MQNNTNPKLSGILFVLGGVAFLFAYLFSQKVAFVGVGVAFIAIGASWIARSKAGPGN